MRITKLDQYTSEEHKSKSKNTQNSYEKANSMLIKKKLQILSCEPAYFQTKIQGDLQLTQNNNQCLQTPINDISFSNCKKQLLGQEINLNLNKETFIDFLQNHIKNQPYNPKNKLKLPQINNKQISDNPGDNEQLVNFQPDVKKIQLGKNITVNGQKTTPKQLLKQNPVFINIKAVIPMEKASSKKKDHSLRDLRILRKEKQELNDDGIFEKSSQDQKGQNRKSSRGTSIQLGNRWDPISTAQKQKRRSQRTSLQKISLSSNVRERRGFSINAAKKKYATTYQDYCLFISTLNKIRLSLSPVVLYRAFVGQGNNSILIKNSIKNRFWWNITTQKNQQTNLLWTQQRDTQFIAALPCTPKPDQKPHYQIVKKLKYHLQAKQQKDHSPIRDFTRFGFSRLLSEKQSRQNGSTPFYAETVVPESILQQIDPQKLKIHNHFESNWNLTNKKALFYNLKTYYELIKEDPFRYIPLTFHVKYAGDKSWDEFKSVYEERLRERLAEAEIKQKKKKHQTKKQKPSLPLWIIKPGENSNQGCGIQVSDSLQEIEQIVRDKTENGKNRSSIIQRYLMPFLYNKRKFDIRCYILGTSIRGKVKGYWYEEGYIRTSSKQFTTKNLKNRMIHLTNDAVQKKGEDYGKYENGNKISFSEFQKYLDSLAGQKKLNFYKTVYPKMMRLARDALTATSSVLNEKNREFTFQIFGLDFMIDQQFETWLIEVNNNPCLELSSPLLARIIPNMIQNAFKIAIDPLFPPPLNIPKSKTLATQLFQTNKFTLIYNSCDIEEGFQKGITQNKVNLDKILEGQEEDDQLIDDEDQTCCEAEQTENFLKGRKINQNSNEIYCKDNQKPQNNSHNQTEFTLKYISTGDQQQNASINEKIFGREDQ